jgi:hypothetical protein
LAAARAAHASAGSADRKARRDEADFCEGKVVDATRAFELATDALLAAQRAEKEAELKVLDDAANEQRARALLAERVQAYLDLCAKLRAAVLATEQVVTDQRALASKAQHVASAIGVSPACKPLPAGLAEAYRGSASIPVARLLDLCECSNPAQRPADWLAHGEETLRSWALDGSYNERAAQHTAMIAAEEKAARESIIGQYCARHSLSGVSMIEGKMRSAAVDNVRLHRDTPKEKSARHQLAGLESLRKASKWPSTAEFERYCIDGDLSWAEAYAPETSKHMRLGA